MGKESKKLAGGGVKKGGEEKFPISFLYQALPTLIIPEDEDSSGCSLRAERPLARAKTSKGHEAGAGSCLCFVF